jgi:plastocyanin
MISGLIAIAAAAIGGAILVADVATAGGGCHGEPAAPGNGDVVAIEQCSFTPGTLQVEAGTTVTFINSDPILHAVTGSGWGSLDLAKGDSFSQTFETEGVFAFSCYLHPGMVGAIVVGDGGVDAGPAVEASGEESAESGDGSSGRWSLAMVGALTGMMATGAAGLAFGRRANR